MANRMQPLTPQFETDVRTHAVLKVMLHLSDAEAAGCVSHQVGREVCVAEADQLPSHHVDCQLMSVRRVDRPQVGQSFVHNTHPVVLLPGRRNTAKPSKKWSYTNSQSSDCRCMERLKYYA